MRSRRLFLLGMVLILLFVLVPNLWGRAERLLYPRKYEALVEQWADTYDLDPLLVDAFIRTESGFDPQATSTVDARGLMQMTEETFIWLRSKIANRTKACSLQISMIRRPASGSDAITCTCAWSATTAMLPLPLLLITAGGGTVDALLQMEEHSADGETLQGFPYSQMNHYVKRSLSAMRNISASMQEAERR